MAVIVVSAFADTSSEVYRADRSLHDDVKLTVDPAAEQGPVKPLNGVNGAPKKRGSENYEAWTRAAFDLARTHDLNLFSGYGAPHVIDIPAVFPDFAADETKRESYDFACTDEVMARIVSTGTKICYRLGGGFEGFLAKRYSSVPPADSAKWARICEHVIAHYNEGWADGFRYGIEYWEIWNEPNLDIFWTGTREQFTELFITALKHLKARFPQLKFGGPAAAGHKFDWTGAVIADLAKARAPLDFFSWHVYAKNPWEFHSEGEWVRRQLDAHGYAATESILGEWNYVKNFGPDYGYSLEVMGGRFADKGAAFVAATLSVLQDSQVDRALIYDAMSAFDSVFENGRPARGYYALVAWAKLRRLGTVVASLAEPERDDLYVTSAKDAEGHLGILLTRFHDDNNRTDEKWVRIAVKGRPMKGARVYRTDATRLNTAEEFQSEADGSIRVRLAPFAFVYLEPEF